MKEIKVAILSEVFGIVLFLSLGTIMRMVPKPFLHKIKFKLTVI